MFERRSPKESLTGKCRDTNFYTLSSKVIILEWLVDFHKKMTARAKIASSLGQRPTLFMQFSRTLRNSADSFDS